MSVLGQNAKYSLRADVFCFASNNGHRSTGSACPFGANRREYDIRIVPNRTHAGLKPAYSITSSARERSEGGMVRPSVFAVLRLITSSNLVGCSTGRSAGLVPFRILST